MDMIQDAATFLFGGAHGDILQSYAPYAHSASTLLSTLQLWTTTLVGLVSQKSDLATVALVLCIVFVSLKILGMLWQTLLFWLRLARLIVFWGAPVLLAVWLWFRGPAGVWEDIEFWTAVWSHEYAQLRERERERLAQAGRQPRVQTRTSWY